MIPVKSYLNDTCVILFTGVSYSEHGISDEPVQSDEAPIPQPLWIGNGNIILDDGTSRQGYLQVTVFPILKGDK